MNVNFTLVLIDEPGLEKVRKDIRLLKGEEYLPGNLIGITDEIIPERVNVWIIENYGNVDSDIREAFSSHAKNIVHCYLEVVGAREVLTVDRDSLNDFWGADSEEDKIAQATKINNYLINNENYFEFVANAVSKTFTFVIGDNSLDQHKVISRITFTNDSGRFTHRAVYREVDPSYDTNYDLWKKGKEKQWVSRVGRCFEIDSFSIENFNRACKTVLEQIDIVINNYVKPEHVHLVNPELIIEDFCEFWFSIRKSKLNITNRSS